MFGMANGGALCMFGTLPLPACHWDSQTNGGRHYFVHFRYQTESGDFEIFDQNLHKNVPKRH